MPDWKKIAQFREKCLANEFILGTSCSTISPVMVEIIGHAGFDFVIVDTEVLSINLETVENMVRAAECSNTIPLIKLKNNDPVMISDALNTGAPAVKVPHVCSADDLKRAVDAAYFHPKGNRGLCPVSRANFYAQGNLSDLVERTNRDVMVIPIIEDAEAVDRIDEIMSVEGIDFYDLGPVDMAHSYRVPPEAGFSDPAVERALKKMIEAAHKYNKRIMTVPVFGGQPLTPELIRDRLISQGVNILFYLSDSAVMRMGMREALKLRKIATE